MAMPDVDAQRSGYAVVVRLWAGARAAARRDEVVVEGLLEGSTVATVTDRLLAECPDLYGVLSVSSLLLDGLAVSGDRVLNGPGTIEVLPPFAGG